MNKNTLLIPGVKLFAAYMLLTVIPSGIYELQIAFTYHNSLSKPLIFIILVSMICLINLILKKPDILSFKNETADDLKTKHVFEIGLLIIGAYYALTAFTNFTSNFSGEWIRQAYLGNSLDYAFSMLRGKLFTSALYQLLIAIFILYRAKKVLPGFIGFKR